jgi:putative addiction module antidote
MFKVKVTTVGNSTGIVLPKEVLLKMKAAKGDTLYLVETADGYKLTPYDQAFEAQLEAAQQVMKKYRNSLRALAK